MLSRREVLARGGSIFAASFVAASIPAWGQDAYEKLGASMGGKWQGQHPLLAIESAHPASLKAELAGVHPRVYFTEEELAELRKRAQTTHAALWKRAEKNMIAPTFEPPAPPAQARRAQNNVALAIAESAFAYKITGDSKYLKLALKFMDAAASYDVWGYFIDKPNIDLAAGHLLYGLGWGYDLLYHDLSEEQRTKFRNCLALHGKLLYDSYKLKPGKIFSYSQNHLFIPAAGLGIASYALYGEVREAAEWARLVRALFDRVMATYSIDGYYYEGFEYWVFATPWIVHYLDALAHSTGEDLYNHSGLSKAHLYVAHSMLPDGNDVFDFGDVFDGPLTRTGKDPEYQRTHPGGHLHSNYHLLYKFAREYRSGEAQGVAEWLASLGQTNFEDYWALAWYDPSIKPVPIEEQSPWHHFKDHDVVYWRTAWDAAATAFAFKCGPPEGHRTAELVKKFPDWRLEEGHAHPDAGSFILYGDKKYLTGVSGYAGVPMSNQVNTLLIDGHGQEHEGHGHDAFRKVPYDRLNKIRITKVEKSEGGLTITGDATAAYLPALGVESFIRTVEIGKNKLTVADQVRLEAAATPSVLIHFDGDGPPAGLQIDVAEPKDAVKKLEPNMITGPGKPGSVDKGPHEQRGTRLEISTAKPVKKIDFETILKW